MACTCSTFDSDSGRFNCSVSGSGCVYMIPDSIRCAKEYGEGPDASQNKCEDCFFFYTENNRRCCITEPYSNSLKHSKYIDKELACCGGFKKRELIARYYIENILKDENYRKLYNNNPFFRNILIYLEKGYTLKELIEFTYQQCKRNDDLRLDLEKQFLSNPKPKIKNKN